MRDVVSEVMFIIALFLIGTAITLVSTGCGPGISSGDASKYRDVHACLDQMFSLPECNPSILFDSMCRHECECSLPPQYPLQDIDDCVDAMMQSRYCYDVDLFEVLCERQCEC